MDRLKDKVAVITGAGSGMGAAMAELFAKEGAKVCALDMNEKNGRKKEALLKDAGYEATFYKADITDRKCISEVYKQIFEKYGKFNILVNNAGCMTPHGMADEINEKNDRIAKTMMEVNVFGTNICSSEAIQFFRKSGGGSIVNIASLSAFYAYPGDWAYMTSKAGVVGMMLSYAVSYASENIRCNCVCPSVVMTEGAIASVKEAGLKDEEIHDMPNPMNKPIRPIDIANAALFLASDDARVISGQWIAVDAAFTAQFPAAY